MKTRPILFKSEMVRAILDGRKTQTRRLLKPQPVNLPEDAYCNPYNGNFEHFTFWTNGNKMILGCGGNIKDTAHWKCPHGMPGDRLWVKETFTLIHPGLLQKSDPDSESSQWITVYRANGEVDLSDYGVPWKPSIFMPRSASRITLDLVGLQVERLNSISAEDCIAEGIDYKEHKCGCEVCSHTSQICPASASSLIMAYAELWESINGKGSWDANPWVWREEFKPIK